ncbi:MAG TPA: serine hydrolase [Thermoanaerobaculia bacterium]|nr:serine hydrolase [Thermoanaerobaculia bacterium]
MSRTPVRSVRPGRALARILSLASFASLASLVACAPPPSAETAPAPTPAPPVAAPPAPPPPGSSGWTGEWRTATPGEAGLEPERFVAAVEEARSLSRVRSLIVLRDGAAVHESHAPGASNAPHNMKSASKGVISALVGIAVELGLIELDQPVADFFPEILGAARDGRARIRIWHLLTMTSGLESTSFRNYGAWAASPDPVRHALTRDLIAEPGERFRYSTGNTHVLSAVLTRASGISTRELAMRHLFGPMGIEPGGWDRDPNGIYLGGNNLALRPRDMAKLGQLYLDRGRWGDRQLVPWRWVDASVESITAGWPSRYGSYGMLWWLRPPPEDGAFTAIGFGGQYVYVDPGAGMVVVVTSTHEAKSRDWERRLFAAIRAMTSSVVEREAVAPSRSDR